MRLLQIGADRSKRGILVPGSAAYVRQRAYAEKIGALDIIGFSLESDGFTEHSDGALRIFPTRSATRLLFGTNAIHMASKLPWPDAVSAQDPFETGLVALTVSRTLKIPLHVQVHTDFLSPEYAKLSLMNRVRIVIAGLVLRRANRIRVVSSRIKDSIERKYGIKSPITVLPIFADVKKFADAQASDELRARFARFTTKFLFVGRLEKEKNPCLAVGAFADAAIADSCLIVIGSGRERARVVAYAKERGVSDRVFFEGELDAVPYVALASALLVPSKYEGYGLTIVEALAAGKPVIATDVGIAKEAGAIVADAAHYAEALRAWSQSGPRTARLLEYPYGSFEEYVQAYCDDIRACIKK